MKKFIAGLVVLIMLLCIMIPCSAETETSPATEANPTSEITLPTSFKAPGKPVANATEKAWTKIYFFIEPDIHEFWELGRLNDNSGISALHIYTQVDWKLNDGPWHYTEDWDTLSVKHSSNSGIYTEMGLPLIHR